MRQLGLVRGRHDDKARKAPKKSDVERPCMGGAVGADEPRPVYRKTHRKRLNRHVMHHLIVAPLQECRIYRAEWLVTLSRQPGSEGHRMLFGDSHIKRSLRKHLPKISSPVPAGSAG